MNRTCLRTAWASAILLLTAACTTSPSAPPADTGTPAYRPPEEVRNATVIWSAEPGVDLFDSNSTLVRAAAEALEVAILAGPEDSYPGFNDAVTDPTTRDLYFRRSTRDTTAYGTLYKHILDVTPTSTGFTARTCELFKAFAYQRDGIYNTSRTGRLGNSKTITFISNTPLQSEAPSGTTPATTPVATPTPRTSGPAEWQAPEDNLFQSWTIDLAAPDDYRSERCAPWVATLDPDAPAEGETVTTDNPPQTLPAYPGWPKLH
ncbi:hypothetical protein HLB23_21125 [Nocardia uniformis]|uniref:Lipoprotein n=1 Tax=Nocardia uniformis TaxID=53432 RepID=A0A849C7F4_9NOCA|nr:hypothetical protein [Nocardia uniformis]NNH72330.1 hypothetical protein [Nocardia uniformis]